MAAVNVTGLVKRFGDTTVLHGVDLSVKDGEFAVLVGPSGCGKSTLLRLLAGLEQADEGKIVFGHDDVTRRAPRERDIAMVFQSYALYPHLTVRDNLGFGLKLRKTPAAEIKTRVDEVAAMLGLDTLLDRMPKALSGGQRQRVAMGRAIVRRPRLFLFDEPLSNLDAALRAQVRVDIRRLHAQLATTSVYVTHDQVEAMTLADVMFVLNGGRVEQSGAPLEVFDKPATRFVAGFLGSPSMNFLDAKVDGGQLVLAGGQRMAAPRALAEERAVTVGVRPHRFEVVADGTHGALVIEVTLTEALGEETYVHGRLGGAAVIARVDPDRRVAAGEHLPVRVAPEHCRVFDAETGVAL